eukprot:m.85573 g.85573  ORF g.85573 m.85573 type:complete len:604 (-) comp8747_c0_seq1:2551-4362(-)
MTTSRKLQGDIDKVIKSVNELLELFETTWEKVENATNHNQKEKYESELKKLIKKLQKQRESIKGWLNGTEAKANEKMLKSYRRKIEEKMELFRDFEKDSKTKAFSKEGLANHNKLNQEDQVKQDCMDSVNDIIDKLKVCIQKIEGKQLMLARGEMFESDDTQERYKDWALSHKQHIWRLETILRLLNGGDLNPDSVDMLKDLFEDEYFESTMDSEFFETDTYYDELEDELRDLGLAGELTVPDISREVALVEPDKKKEKSKKKKKRDRSKASSSSTTQSPPPQSPSIISSSPKKISSSTSTPQTMPSNPKPFIPTPIPTSTTVAPKPQPIPKKTPVITPSEAPPPSMAAVLSSNISSSTTKTSASIGNSSPSQNPSSKLSPAQNFASVAKKHSSPRSTSSLPTPQTTQSLPPGLSVPSNQKTPLPTQSPVQPPTQTPQQPKQQTPPPQVQQTLLERLEGSQAQCLEVADYIQIRDMPYKAPLPVAVPSSYPPTQMREFTKSEFYQHLDIDTLFFMFYHQPCTIHQALAAKELRRNGWRFHTANQMWFLRTNPPTQKTATHEIGSYRYFNFERDWKQKSTEQFKFDYQYLESSSLETVSTVAAN